MAGEKFADADLIGIPLRLVFSDKTADQASVEVKARTKTEAQLISIESLGAFLDEYLKKIVGARKV